MRDLLLSLLRSESAKDVKKVLKEHGIWDNPSCWRLYGDDETNFTTIGNQQAESTAALAEKLTNAMDAVLMRECLIRGIDPRSESAPGNPKEAVKQFLGLDFPTTKSPDEIYLVATGVKDKLTLSIIDRGEGQAPENFHRTFLALKGKNKVGIPFLHGRFNMGGSGALVYCKDGLQLIVSRRHPDLARKEGVSKAWGFTVVRVRPPRPGEDFDVYEYMVIDGRIPEVDLPFLPYLTEHIRKPFKHGTLIKLFDYQHEKTTLITMGLMRDLELVLPEAAIPIKVLDTRFRDTDPHKIHSLSTLRGVNARFLLKGQAIMEEGFPVDFVLNVHSYRVPGKIFLVRPGARDPRVRKVGLTFLFKGQAHYQHDPAFFSRKSVGLSTLRSNLYVTLDFSALPTKLATKIFMPSRDRMRKSPVAERIMKLLEDTLAQNAILRETQDRWRERLIRRSVKQKGFKSILQKLAKSNPVLRKVLFGKDTTAPIPVAAAPTGKCACKRKPTFFDLPPTSRGATPEVRKLYAEGASLRVILDTDASKTVLKRADVSVLLITEDGHDELTEVSVTPYDCRLVVNLPPLDFEVGDEFTLVIKITVSGETFEVPVYCRTVAARESESGESKRAQPPAKKGVVKRLAPVFIPEIRLVGRDGWNEVGFDAHSVVKLEVTPEAFDIIVNIDNAELKQATGNMAKHTRIMVEKLYPDVVALLAVGLYGGYAEEEEENVVEKVEKTLNTLGFILPSIVQYLATADVNEILAAA